MKIIVKRDLCIGIGACVALASKTFELDHESKAIIPKVTVRKEGENDIYEISDASVVDTMDDIIMAAEACPVSAIFVYDDAGTQLYPRA